jgi:hypothetical protein
LQERRRLAGSWRCHDCHFGRNLDSQWQLADTKGRRFVVAVYPECELDGITGPHGPAPIGNEISGGCRANFLKYGVEFGIMRSIISRDRRFDSRKFFRECGAGCDKLTKRTRLRITLPSRQLVDRKLFRIGIDQPPTILAKP